MTPALRPAGREAFALPPEITYLNTAAVNRSFVQHLAIGGDDLAVVRSTIELAHHLGLRVVAEAASPPPPPPARDHQGSQRTRFASSRGGRWPR
jgi:hypothetical protein